MCTLMRNLNFEKGLVDGSKVIITKVQKFLLEVVPGVRSKTFLIPRVQREEKRESKLQANSFSRGDNNK